MKEFYISSKQAHDALAPWDYKLNDYEFIRIDGQLRTFMVCYLFGQPGWLLPVIPGEERVRVHHCSDFYSVEELLTHRHPLLREAALSLMRSDENQKVPISSLDD